MRVRYEDQKCECSDCGEAFTFTGGERLFYERRALSIPPKRCPECRAYARAAREAASEHRAIQTGQWGW